MTEQEKNAKKICDAIRNATPDTIDNFESYLSNHGKEWFERWGGRSLEQLATELENFLTMEV